MTVPRAIVLGAGYAGLRAIQELTRRSRPEELELVLVNKHNYHQLITELHQPAAGAPNYDEFRVPLADIVNMRRVHFIKDTVQGIALDKKKVVLTNGDIPFDYLVAAPGSQPDFYNIPGLQEHAMSLRSLNAARLIRTHIENAFARAKNTTHAGERKALLTVVIGGGGLTGVELAGELADWMPELAHGYDANLGETKLLLIEAEPQILAGLDQNLVLYTTKALEEKGVEILTGERIAEAGKRYVQLAGGRTIPTASLIWAAGIRGNPILEESGLQLDRHHRALVNNNLQAIGHPNVFVAGDSAELVENITPTGPNAQVAMAQGRIAGYNVLAMATGKDLRLYRPVKGSLLASLGRNKGIGRLHSWQTRGMPAALLKEIVPIRYLYSLGGMRLFAKRLFKDT